MLPRATVERTSRERNGPGGRTQEIQRLIGRSLRAAMGTMAFGEYTIRVDCDVLQADGGTRTAGITGGVRGAGGCLRLAGRERTGVASPFGRLVAAVSVGRGRTARSGSTSPTSKTRDADVDANVVMLSRRGSSRCRARVSTTASPGPARHAARHGASAGIARAVPGATEGARLVKLLAATRSTGKQREFRRILEPAGHRGRLPGRCRRSRVPARTCSSSARASRATRARKAEYFATLSGLPTVADDSGLEVFSLGGAPGVRSRRWAGAAGPPERWTRPTTPSCCDGCAARREPRRRARYRCVLVLLRDPGAVPEVFEGICGGRILEAPRGKGGFGYDPLFFSDELG